MSWLDELPETLRQAPFLAKAESAEDAMGKLTHAAKIVGSSVRIPGEDATDDDRKAFYDKLGEVPGVTVLPDIDDIEGQTGVFRKMGAPEDAAKYELPEIDDFEWDENVAKDLRSYAAEAGMTKAQFKRFAQKIGEQEHQAAVESEETRTENQKKLKSEWGTEYEDRENLIRGWMDKSEAPESMRQLLDDGNLSPEAMKWLYDTAKNFKGDVSPMAKDGPQGGNNSMTPDEAREKMADLRASEAYWDASHPMHKDYVTRMIKYQKLASGRDAA